MTKKTILIFTFVLLSTVLSGCTMMQNQGATDTEMDSQESSATNPGSGAGINTADDSLPAIESELENTVILDEDFSDL